MSGTVVDERELQMNNYLEQGDFSAADRLARKILNFNAQSIAALRARSMVCAKQGRIAESLAYLKQALELAPTDTDIFSLYILTLHKLERQQDIVSAYQGRENMELVAPVLVNIGSAMEFFGKYESALRLYQRAVAAGAVDDGVKMLIASMKKTLGMDVEAVEDYKNIKQPHQFANAMSGLASLKIYQFSDADMVAMHVALADESLSENDRVVLHFTLAKAYEKAKDFDGAFNHYQQGNKLQELKSSFNSEQYAGYVNRVMAYHQGESYRSLFARQKAIPSVNELRPVFILGLPRSGSTLVEQILASHSAIEGTRELPYIQRLLAVIGKSSTQEKYPEYISGLTIADVASLKGIYLTYVAKHLVAGKSFFIDKTPSNFERIGFIKLLFPNALIINTVRSDFANAFSIYKQYFYKGFEYSTQLTKLAAYIVEERRLCQFWNGLFPGEIFTVSYEALVADQRKVTTEILNYCNLPFEDACLSFHETARGVYTPSAQQVKTPIYAGANDEWRKYSGHLSELKEAFRALNMVVPE